MCALMSDTDTEGTTRFCVVRRVENVELANDIRPEDGSRRRMSEGGQRVTLGKGSETSAPRGPPRTRSLVVRVRSGSAAGPTFEPSGEINNRSAFYTSDCMTR